MFDLLLLTCMIGIGKFIKFKDTQLDEITITPEIGHNFKTKQTVRHANML